VSRSIGYLFDFPFILTDSLSNSVCCTFGSGGPVELFDGALKDGALLFSNPFQETPRIVESFTLVGDGTFASSSPTSNFPIFGLTLTILIFALGLYM
jgi:hypothetical protein